MKPYTALIAAAVGVVVVVAMVASCDPDSSATPGPSVVVVHDDHHAGTGHGSTSRKTTRPAGPRRGASMSRRSTSVTKLRR